MPSSPTGHDLVTPATRLTSLFKPTSFRNTPPAQPDIPLSQSDLLVNATGEPRVGPMLQSEIDSADRIDVLIAFIRWSGLRLVCCSEGLKDLRDGVVHALSHDVDAAVPFRSSPRLAAYAGDRRAMQ